MTDFEQRSVYYKDAIVPFNEAQLSIAGSAVLYGLSVYTVFPINKTASGGIAAFRLRDHFNRLLESARIIGIDTFARQWTYDKFEQAVKELAQANDIRDDVFVRATVHVDELVPGTRSRGLHSVLSMFIYPAHPIVPQNGARLKTSVWRRVPDNAIPARAKVNGAYVNSVLGKQDAIDSGYDDCVFLDGHGHVCELSAANIFIVKNGTLITPSTTSDILEGINRKTVLDIAKKQNIPVEERTVDLTELYIADEAFACGTSAFIAPITDVDARQIGTEVPGPITAVIRSIHSQLLHGEVDEAGPLLTLL